MSALALAYHGVSLVPFDDDRYRLFVAPTQLDRHIGVLQRWGYRFVTFGELATLVAEAGPADVGRVVALTFDDGLADNRTGLLPVLAARGVPATVFVVSGWLGSPHPDAPDAKVLSDADVVALHRAGVEIGGHTVGHVDLRSASDASLQSELGDGREQLEAIIDAPVRSFAYPYGHADDRVRSAVAAAGYTAACRTSGEGSWADPFDLPRQAMGNGSSALGLRLKRAARYEAVLRMPGAPRLRRLSRRAHNWQERRVAGAHPTSLPPPVA